MGLGSVDLTNQWSTSHTGRATEANVVQLRQATAAQHWLLWPILWGLVVKQPFTHCIKSHLSLVAGKMSLFKIGLYWDIFLATRLF